MLKFNRSQSKDAVLTNHTRKIKKKIQSRQQRREVRGYFIRESAIHKMSLFFVTKASERERKRHRKGTKVPFFVNST